MAAGGSYTSTAGYGPISGWTATAVAGGSDSLTRLLLNRSDGAAAVWTLDGGGYQSSTPLYGPYGGYTCRSVAVGGDNLTRLLWVSAGGVGVWTVAGSGGFTSTPFLSTPSGYTAVGIAGGGDNKVRLLWGGSGGSAQVWTIATDGTYTAATYTALLAPVGLTAVAAVNNQASLSWSSVPGAVSYNVKRSTTNGSGYSTVATVTSTSYIDQGLTNGTAYYYVVTAVSGTSESTPSNQVTATPTAQAFGFLNVGNDSTVSGTVTIITSLGSAGYGDLDNLVTLQVDGVDNQHGGDIQSSLDGQAGSDVTFYVDTTTLFNGPHTLTVKDAKGNFASANLTTSNIISSAVISDVFDPSGRDGLPTTATVSATVSAVLPWTVTITSADPDTPTTLRTFSGTSNTINMAWDGNDANGNSVASDVYQMVVQAGTSSSSRVMTSSALGGASIRPNHPPGGGIQSTRKAINKNTPGDCFLLMDQGVMPPGAYLPCLKAIRADLARTKGVEWNTMSVLGISTSGMTPAIAARINRHFSSPLTVFYFDGHGGMADHPYFEMGSYDWLSEAGPNYPTSHMTFDVSVLCAGIYDSTFGSYPPKLVFIDCCKSGGGEHQSASPYLNETDLQWATDFDIGDGGGAFLGSNKDCVMYGQLGPPHDDWTFWRLDLWNQFTNNNQTYYTDYAHLQRDYNPRISFAPVDTPQYRMDTSRYYNDNDNF